MERLKRLIPFAQKSNCYHKHAAAVVKGGRILSVGYNKNRNPGRAWEDNKPCSEHAEVAALRQIKDASGVTVYVMRISRNGTLGLSAPCTACKKYIKSRGVKKVIYSNDIEI